MKQRRHIHAALFVTLGVVAVATLAACGGNDTPTPTPTATPTSFTAILKTEKGDITIELFAKDAPKTVANFVSLARSGFYDNTTFHRVIAGFMAQGGDPTGTGTGGPGYTIEDEIENNPNTHEAGVISMANKGVPNSGGSQFFITLEPQHHLDGKHTVFGKVVEGMDVVRSLTLRDPATATTPGDKLFTVEIIEK